MQEINAKWRTIRDNYIRNLKKQAKCSKSGSATKKIRQYVFGEQLSFLKKTKDSRSTDSSSDYAPTREDETDNFEKIERDSMNCVNDGISPEIASSTSLNIESTNKRKTPNVERTSAELMENRNAMKKALEDDEDIAFFYSLLPSVKSLTRDKKFTFRMQTMQLLQEHLRTT